MKRYSLIFLLLGLAAIVACQPAAPAANTTNQSAPVFNVSNQTNQSGNETDVRVSLNSTVDYEVTGTEGDVITLPITADDPDGDDVTYEYEAPFDDNGVWQTELGDAGTYVVQVNATDGQATTRATALVDVERANRAPVIDCPDRFTFREGERASVNCNIYDPEGSSVLVRYQGWTTSRTKQVSYTEAGDYSVTIVASDEQNNTAEQNVPITVRDVNRAPEIEDIDDRSVQETSTFSIDPVVSDPDGDNVTVNYTAPLNDDGVWETSYGDAGQYNVTVLANDGDKTAKETFTISVGERNQAPVIRPLENISVDEGDTVTIRPEAYDPDGDDVELTYSGWMDNRQYQTTYEDAYPEGCSEKGCTAAYTVFVEASDGDLTTQRSLTVFVDDVNRAPNFQR